MHRWLSLFLCCLLIGCAAQPAPQQELPDIAEGTPVCWYLLGFQGAEPAWYRILAVDCTTTADCLVQRDGIANPESILSMAQNVTCAVERP